MKTKIFYLGLFLVCFFQACRDPETAPQAQDAFRTVLVYLAANNNLAAEAERNIKQMEEGLDNGLNGNLVVYVKLPGERPSLYQIHGKSSPQGGRKKIKDYGPHDSSDPATLRLVLEDVRSLFPAKGYGLVLWSHATGWVPGSHGNVKLKSFGDDGGSQMDVKELDTALPYELDFLMFDACSMAGVEVLYEIRDRARIFIASPGEVIATGMPYDRITNDMLASDAGAYVRLAQKYHDYYDHLAGGYRSATISVIDAAQLTALARDTRQLIRSQPPQHEDYNRSQIQRMDFDRSGNPLIAFDFMDFMNQNYSQAASYPALEATLARTVLFKANTPMFNGIPIDKNSGLSCYIPHPDNEPSVHAYYRILKWYADSGFDAFL